MRHHLSMEDEMERPYNAVCEASHQHLLTYFIYIFKMSRGLECHHTHASVWEFPPSPGIGTSTNCPIVIKHDINMVLLLTKPSSVH
jgi:hypothetical protein